MHVDGNWAFVLLLSASCSGAPARPAPRVADATVSGRPGPPARPSTPPPVPWRNVSAHGFSDVFGESGVFARGDRLARLEGDIVRWDDCRLQLPDVVEGVDLVRQASSGGWVALVRFGIQASKWMSWSEDSGGWTDLPGGYGDKRTELMVAGDSLSRSWLFRREAPPHGGVEWGIRDLAPPYTKLTLRASPAGCVERGVSFFDFRVDHGMAALLCDRGVEQWRVVTSHSNAATSVHAPPPAEMTLETGDVACGAARAPRWAGLRITSDGPELIAPSLDGAGTHIAHFRDGSWGEVRRLTTEVVSAYLPGAQADFFTTATKSEEGGCATQLWRREGQAVRKLGAAIHGGRVWLLAGPNGWPIVVTETAIFRWRPSGETIVLLPPHKIHSAVVVSGDVWLESDKGWLSQHHYRERGTPDAPCGDE